jgi:ribosome-binding protein aMBF1 (putative translation factor)
MINICGWCGEEIPPDSKIISHGAITIVCDANGRAHKFSNSINKRIDNEKSRIAKREESAGTDGFDEETARQENDSDDLAAGLADIFGGTDGESA